MSIPVIIISIIVVVLLIANSVTTRGPDEVAVVYRFGKEVAQPPPGMFFTIPIVDITWIFPKTGNFTLDVNGFSLGDQNKIQGEIVLTWELTDVKKLMDNKGLNYRNEGERDDRQAPSKSERGLELLNSIFFEQFTSQATKFLGQMSKEDLDNRGAIENQYIDTVNRELNSIGLKLISSEFKTEIF